MGRLIKIQEIDNFSEVISIPNDAINEEIISNIKKLDEKNELEKFLRQILYDPNETAHGPVEIADILTTNVNIKGEKRFAAFVLKGKSIQKVSSKKVTHQFLKLRTIENLGLIVFAAVGNIFDDAQRDFAITATDMNCDYIIINAHDLARLLIAYEKICPKDGTLFNEIGICKKGHKLDEGIMLNIKVREKTQYTIVKQKDLSYSVTKRYLAIILLDRHYPRDVIKTIIKEATERMKSSNYHRNEKLKNWWRNIHAHVVWLQIAYDLEDINNANWVCQTCWINPSLPNDKHPIKHDFNDYIDDIEIFWNNEYKNKKDFVASYYGTKEEFLESNQPILNEMVQFAKQGIKYFKEYKSGSISEEELILKIQKIEPRVSELYRFSGNIPLPPEDCKDYNQACQDIYATIHNMFIYYSEEGLSNWDKSRREWLFETAINKFNEILYRIEFEEGKIH